MLTLGRRRRIRAQRTEGFDTGGVVVIGKTDGMVFLHIADYAAGFDIRVSAEHFPGSPLPTIAAMLVFLRGVGHPNLYLLLDIGHAQPHVREMTFTGRPMTGYVYVDADGLVTDARLQTWVDLALSFVKTLPPKVAGKRTRR